MNSEDYGNKKKYDVWKKVKSRYSFMEQNEPEEGLPTSPEENEFKDNLQDSDAVRPEKEDDDKLVEEKMEDADAGPARPSSKIFFFESDESSDQSVKNSLRSTGDNAADTGNYTVPAHAQPRKKRKTMSSEAQTTVPAGSQEVGTNSCLDKGYQPVGEAGAEDNMDWEAAKDVGGPGQTNGGGGKA